MIHRTDWGMEFPQEEEDGIRAFAAGIGDFNPLHHDNEAAQKAGYLGIIAPGVKIFGFISKAIAEEFPNASVRSVELKFSEPIYAKSWPFVSCSVTAQKDRLLKLAVEVKSGFILNARGNCTVFLPDPAA